MNRRYLVRQSSSSSHSEIHWHCLVDNNHIEHHQNPTMTVFDRKRAREGSGEAGVERAEQPSSYSDENQNDRMKTFPLTSIP